MKDKSWDFKERLAVGEVLGHQFKYNPITGELWKLHKKKNIGWYKCTHKAKNGNTEYYRIKINGKIINQHRIIWYLMKQEWPEMIDHINGIGSDNRWVNLRSTNNRDNQANTKKHREGRLPGTYFKTTKYWQGWIAQINLKNKKTHLGCFNTEKEAHEAYLLAKEELNEQ